MVKIYPDNPALYARRIRTSYRIYLKYHSKYPNFEPPNKALIKKLVTEAKRDVNLSNTEIIKSYFDNERENVMLRALRIINKLREIKIHADNINEKERLLQLK